MDNFPRPSVSVLLYIAGPFTASKQYPSINHNIENAQKVGKIYLEMGYTVFIPHSNWGVIERKLGLRLPYRDMMRRCYVVLARSDAVVFLPGWETSKGTQAELRFCEARGIPYKFHEE